ncbi:MAG: putative sigma-54 modulation protein [Bradymonadia bacterium]|jgi:putative sigma-54 modulation protein
MQIEITSTNFPIDAETLEVVESRVHSAFDRFEHDVRRVTVVFEDTNGPKGGVDTRCRVEITGDRLPDVVTHADGVFVGQAASAATKKAGRIVASHLDKLARHRDRTSA